MTKPYEISKHLVLESYRAVKAKGGSAGVDQESIEAFEKNLKGNLYKLWNRLSSGSYFPPPVKGVAIPKKTGGKRMLGVPTVADRIAQTVVKEKLEPLLEPIFHQDSYGYRPNRSALDAVGVVRGRCWRYDWVVEFDISKFFDTMNHELMMRAVGKHCQIPWVLLYIERWLKAPMVNPEGELVDRTMGTPQGGVISGGGTLLTSLTLAIKSTKSTTSPPLNICKSGAFELYSFIRGASWFLPAGLKGNPVKIRDSTRCCNPQRAFSPECFLLCKPLSQATGSGRRQREESQKTCRDVVSFGLKQFLSFHVQGLLLFCEEIVCFS